MQTVMEDTLNSQPFELNLFQIQLRPAPLLKSIIYCEFDPHRGPRPVYQAPDEFVSADVLECLSDHLISSSDLCGRLVSVSVFGLHFVGHPEHIFDERYERNQLMFNVCFVFESQTDHSPYHPLVKQLAAEFRQLEVEQRFLTTEKTRPLIQNILEGVVSDINTRGELRIPPEGCEWMSEHKNIASVQTVSLQECLPPAVPDSLQPHEVPILVSANTQLLMKAGDGENDQNREKIVNLMRAEDKYLPIQAIATQLNLQVDEVISCVRQLLYIGIVRTIDIISPWNIYVPTSRIRDLIHNPHISQQCVSYCRAGGVVPAVRDVLDLLLHMQPEKSLAQVCCERGLCGCGKEICESTSLSSKPIDVKRLITFARCHRFLRLVEHYPVYTGPPLQNTPGSHILALCDGEHAYDSISIALGIPMKEVMDECENNDDVIIIKRMSPAGSTAENP